MLLSLRIRNFALIENAEIEFGEGLNVLSGETGAGKSILVEAIELLSGGRGTSDLIRLGEEEAEVAGLFAKGDEEISLRRVVSRSGKNRAYLNERPVPVAALAERGGELFELANQHEHQILLNPERHRDLLDAFAGLEEKVGLYRASLESYREILREKEGLTAREKEAREREEFLRFQQKELSEVRIQEGEEERLQTEREVLKHAVRIGEAFRRADEGLDSGEDAITARTSRILRELQDFLKIDPQIGPIAEGLEQAVCHLQEAARQIRGYGEKASADPERLQEVEERLFLISRLKKKHGGSLESLMKKEREIAESLRLFDNFEGEILKKDQELSCLAKELVSKAGNLSRERKKEGVKFSREIERDLKDLGMAEARFSAKIQPLSEGLLQVEETFFDAGGMDGIEFQIAPNPGEGWHPLAKIASGGELSRLFLALKKLLAGVRGAPTCIFDEIDAGIGGKVAEVVGRNLSLLSRRLQVLCVTHLPQIACYARHHFIIQKRTEKGRTGALIQLLKSEEREEEIARMLAGLQVTAQAKAHAREMLRNAGARG